MEKLELKHLAPYLPYRLQIDVSKLKNGYLTCTILDKTSLTYISIADVIDEFPYVKPIFKPIIDLKKDKKLIQDLDKISFGTFSERYDDFIKNINKIPHILYEELIKNHYDVFGLIEKGLAVNINTLNQ